MSKVSPFLLSNPLYRIAADQDFATEEISFKPIVEMLELLFGRVALGSFCMNVIDFRDFSYPYNSPNITDVVGYTTDEVSNIDWLMRVIHPDDLPVFLKYSVEVMSYIQKLPIESKRNAMINHCYRIRHGKRHEYMWLYQQHHMSHIDKKGALVYSISLNTDVSHLQQAGATPTWSVTEKLSDGSTILHLASSGQTNNTASQRSVFTPREVEVLKMAARGLSASETAQSLRIGHQTALTHRKNVIRKSKSKNLAEAVAFALNTGYL